MNNKLLALALLAASGCGQVLTPEHTTHGSNDSGDDDDTGMSGSDGSNGSDVSGTFSGTVLDERNDVLDVSSGELVHVHGGAPIDLTTTGCPAVYKYAYLEQAHTYGRENMPNPIAWTIPSNIDAYRVVDDDGGTLLDWVTRDTSATRIELDRSSVPALGTKTAKMHLQLRTSSGETSAVCWENHPMAAPIMASAPTKGVLFGMTFANHSPISQLVNASSYTDSHFGVTVMTFPITQYVGEVTPIDVEIPKPTGLAVADLVAASIAVSSEEPAYTCGNCSMPYSDTHTNKSAQVDGTWQLALYDDDVGTLLCRSTQSAPLSLPCTIPARTAGVRSFHVVLSLAAEPTFAPTSVTLTETSFTDITQAVVGGTKQLMGMFLAGNPTHACGAMGVVNGVLTCVSPAYWYSIVTLNEAKIAFDAIMVDFKVGGAVPSYLSALSLPPQSWDSGNAGF
ncbi:MAG: hypothetical protein QM831_33760 [Kofleriaceae bacterium]